MYRPKKNTIIYHFFSWYIRHIIKKDFKHFKYRAIAFNPHQSILLLANHFSWWDGFWMFRLNQLLFKKKFHVLVNSENYHQHHFLKYLGAFAAPGQLKSLPETIKYAASLLEDPQNLVLIFPQGALQDYTPAAISFKKGAAEILKSCTAEVEVIYAVNTISWGRWRKPSVELQLHKASTRVHAEMEKEYQQYFNQAQQAINRIPA